MQHQDFLFDSDHPGDVYISSSDKFPNTAIKILLPSAKVDELSVDQLPEYHSTGWNVDSKITVPLLASPSPLL